MHAQICMLPQCCLNAAPRPQGLISSALKGLDGRSESSSLSLQRPLQEDKAVKRCLSLWRGLASFLLARKQVTLRSHAGWLPLGVLLPHFSLCCCPLPLVLPSVALDIGTLIICRHAYICTE